jgi:transcriptional regulator with XRE-family HTH domain
VHLSEHPVVPDLFMAMQTQFEDLPAFGRRLRRARRAHGMKQAALADLLGVNQATVSRWEQGLQVPAPAMQAAAFGLVSAPSGRNEALKRLVESCVAPVHLIEEASHVCLTYSRPRARDWRVSHRELLGTTLWRFATDEIRAAEEELAAVGWWEQQWPEPRRFRISSYDFEAIRICAGGVLWERLYLEDGTPVRLVTGLASQMPR